MVSLNEQARLYMEKFHFQHIVLDVDKITSWCAPPLLEITVSFTDKTCEEMEASGYRCDESELGKVYYPAEGIEIIDTITVRYERYPWIECFEVDGIDIPKNEKINPMELNSLNNEFSFDFTGDILEAVSEET